MLRAEGLYYGYRALPDHPHADRWKQMAETLAFDNLHQWEAEDATIYHPIWLNALFSYVTISEQQDLYDSPLLRYYAEYFRQLFTPTRTRLTDDKMGYTWDRIVTYVKPEGVFIVVDAVEVDVEDYYTFTNFWHTQHLRAQGPHYYDTSIDSIESVALPQDKRLLIHFLDNEAKADSFFVQDRHGQEEHAIYQSKASHYRVGDHEVFVTALFPHDPDAADPYLDKLRVLPTARYPDAIGLAIDRGAETSYLGLKLDLESEVVRENIRPRYTWDAGRTPYGPFETDAHFSFGTVEADSVRYAASQVLRVRYEDEVLMEALPNTHGLQPDGSDDRVGYVKWRFWEDVVGWRR